MARISPAAAHHRAKIASLSRCVKSGERSADDAELTDARRSLAVEKLAQHAKKVVGGWPTPTPEQLEPIAALLRSGGATSEILDGGGVDGAA